MKGYGCEVWLPPISEIKRVEALGQPISVSESSGRVLNSGESHSDVHLIGKKCARNMGPESSDYFQKDDF